MIKKLSAFVKGFWLPALLAPLTISLEVVVDLLIPRVMARLIDSGIKTGDIGYTVRSGLIMLLLSFLGLAFGVLSGVFASRASAGFGRNLRRGLFRKVQDFSFENIDKFSTGGLITRLTTDVSNIQMAFMMIMRIAFRAPLTMIFSLVMALTINPKLTIIFVCAVPILAVTMLALAKKVHGMFMQVFKTYDKLNMVVQENLRGIRVVKSFVREDYEKKKFGDIADDIYRQFTRVEKLLVLNQPIMQSVIYICMILVSWFGARIIVLTHNTELTTGLLTSFFTYAMQMLSSLMMLGMIYVMLTMSRSASERVCEVLDEEPTIQNPDHPVTEVADGSIRFDHVDFSYSGDRDKLAMRDVDLSIRSGEIVGILGSTGSAKTTLVQLIPRLYDTTSGSVYVGGRDVRDYDLKALRDAVAMVLQKNELFSGSIKENLRWGNENATDEELMEACRLAQADGFISEMPDGYDTHIEQGGTNVSGGQKQRLCIARALLKKPKILILDDSTSAVDTRTDALIRRGFREYIPDTTKIIIAQRVSSVEDADKIIILDDGRVSAVGTHAELLETSSIYREVYESQTKGGSDNG